VAFKAKDLGGDGVEIPAALVAMTATIRAMVNFAENSVNSLGHECQQLRASAKRRKVRSGPTP
jgi:hypothetical protein